MSTEVTSEARKRSLANLQPAWKPGQSGNPSGRKHDRQKIEHDRLLAIELEKFCGFHDREPSPAEAHRLDALVLAIMAKPKNADEAFRQAGCIDRISGKLYGHAKGNQRARMLTSAELMAGVK